MLVRRGIAGPLALRCYTECSGNFVVHVTYLYMYTSNAPHLS
jgi:hypothetical protein